MILPFITTLLALPLAPTADDNILKSLHAIDAATSIAYTAELTRDETDLPTGRTTHSSIRGQVWLEHLPAADSPADPATPSLRWKIALNTVLDAPAAKFEGATAYWAYDADKLRMLHPEQRRADVRDPTPANLSIITGFLRSTVIAPGVTDPAQARAAVAAAASVEPLGTRPLHGATCRGFRLHFADNPDHAMSDNWNEWWIGPDDLPRAITTNFIIAGKHVVQSLLLTEVRLNQPIPAFIFTPEIPSTFNVPAQPAPASATHNPPAAADTPKPQPLKVGDPAPPIQLNDGASTPRSLAARNGSVTVIDFWGTWCAPCCIALPHLDTLSRKFAPQGLEVWAISCKEPDDADPVQYAAARNLSLTILPHGDLTATRYAVTAYPTTLVIARDGTIAFISTGYSPDKITQLEQAIEAALNAKP